MPLILGHGGDSTMVLSPGLGRARGLPLSEIYGTLGVCSFFSVASVLCLARSDVLVEFPFAWSFCTTISLIESLLFPQQSCQKVVL